ncbi:hypothetical protein M9Y10_031397 [Tritrichomonas musculus]|uniref:Helicase ATP-binding domain-containing protein n=1 Tax=Tritrichomonas musculus TaxID=1915356 RepID=A0ABR2H0H4_9EUKA
MAQNVCQYIESEIFDNIPYNYITFTREQSTGSTTLKYREKKFIIDAPIGCGKSSAVCKWIFKTVLNQNGSSICSRDNQEYPAESKFILIVPTINIASEFYNKIYRDIILLNNVGESEMNKYLTLCIKDGAFDEFKKAFTKNVKIIITTYSTASRCLGSLVECSYHSRRDKDSVDNKQSLAASDDIDLDNYTLIIDEAHLLLNNIPLIEIIRDFNNVGLLSATINDIAGLSVFKDYRIIKPDVKTQYNRNIFIHQLGNKQEEISASKAGVSFRAEGNFVEQIIELIRKEKPNYDKILIKIEDKNEGMLMKNAILADSDFSAAIYNGDKKEVSIDENGKIYDILNKNREIDVIIATSTIQAGQSLKENILQVFIQTPLDTVSSVEQFIGRNRLNNSTTHLFLNIVDSEKKQCKVRQSLNRYEYRLNKLRANTWNNMTIDSWCKVLKKLGKVKVRLPAESSVNLQQQNVLEIVNGTIPDDKNLVSKNKPNKYLGEGGSFAKQESLKEPGTNFQSAIEPPLQRVLQSRPKDLATQLECICENISERNFAGKQINKEFKGLKNLYKYYGFKKPPENFKIVMSKRIVDDKRVRMYKLVEIERQDIEKQEIQDSSFAAQSCQRQKEQISEDGHLTLNSKELNIIFKGKKALYKYYDIKECPQGYTIQTKTLNEAGKRTRAYWLSAAMQTGTSFPACEATKLTTAKLGPTELAKI